MHSAKLRLPGRWGRRHLVLALCFLAVFVGYTDRVNIAVASVAMREEFGWTQTTKGAVLSAFAIGYLLLMAVSGWLANRFGGRNVLLVAVVGWSLFTLLTPASAFHSVALLIAVRIALGMGESAVFPASYDLLGRWIPAAERGRAIAVLYSGVPLGQIVGLSGTAWLTVHYGWAVAFYVFGGLGFIWALAWVVLVRNDPVEDHRVSSAERALLEREHGKALATTSGVPWAALLRYPPVWALVAGVFCSNWCLYFFLAWLPSYFAEALGLSLSNAGLFASAPWLAAFVGANAAALIGDAAIGRGVSATRVRKVTLCGGLVLCGLFMLLTRELSSPALALIYISVAGGALGVTWSGYGPNVLDVSPRHASVVAGFSNTIGTLPGIAGVAVVGWLVDVTGTYAAAFMLTGIITMGGAALYFFFGSATPMPTPSDSSDTPQVASNPAS